MYNCNNNNRISTYFNLLHIRENLREEIKGMWIVNQKLLEIQIINLNHDLIETHYEYVNHLFNETQDLDVSPKIN